MHALGRKDQALKRVQWTRQRLIKMGAANATVTSLRWQLTLYYTNALIACTQDDDAFMLKLQLQGPVPLQQLLPPSSARNRQSQAGSRPQNQRVLSTRRLWRLLIPLPMPPLAVSRDHVKRE